MSTNGLILATQLVIDRFKRAAVATNFGYQDNDNAIQLAGLRAVDRAAKDLDRLLGPEGRQALIPLLDDPDPSIVVFAAGYLLRRFPERALAALQMLRRSAPSDVRMTVSSILWDYDHGILDM